MPVGSLHRELTDTPWLVSRMRSDLGAAADELVIHFVDILDEAVGEPRMIARLVSPKSIRTLTQHEFEVAKG